MTLWNFILIPFVLLATMASAGEINGHLEKTVGRNSEVALLLDYDGTLSPIVQHPDLAVIPPETKILLEKLTQCDKVFIAIISGRQADNVKKMVGLENITYAGSHGFEIIYPDGTKYHHKVPEKDKQDLMDVENALKTEVARDGSWVENKGDVLTFHYRETPENKRPDLIKHAQEVIRRFGLDPSDALCAIEIAPKIKWHKGYAGEYILKSKFGNDWENKVKVIFAGDDTSDEKLMEMFEGRAATFRVSPLETVKTSANLRLDSPKDVKLVLKWIVENVCN